jgi:soluble lytic murein transglycosylase
MPSAESPTVQATQTDSVPPTATVPPPTTTPQPTQTPTPEAEALDTAGDRLLFNGDWETSRQEFQNDLASGEDPEAQADSLLGIAKTYALEGQASSALQTLRQVTSDFPDSESEPRAYFQMGQVLESLQRYGEAADAYRSYLALRPGAIDSYVFERIGDSLRSAGDLEGALEAYTNSLEAQPTGGVEPLQIKIADLHASMGDYTSAIQLYQEIAAASGNDFIKAQMDYLTGIAYRLLNQPEESLAAFQHAVESYPEAYSAYLSLVELVDSGVAVNELDRGIIDYHAGQYGVAVAALDRYLASNPDGGQGTAHYYRGLSLLELGDYEGAIAAWDRVILDYPNATVWDSAMDEKAFTLWAYLDQHGQAAQMLNEFSSQNPDHPRAAEFAFDAARITERSGNLQEAAALWDQLALSHPSSPLAYRSLFLAGITQYRLRNYDQARVIFERTLGLAVTPAEVAASNLWLGKADEVLGEPVTARAAWERASIADPTGYYSERARDLLLERKPFEPPSAFDSGIDWDAERAAAEKWLRETYNLPATLDLSGPGALAGDPRFIRGTELWNLGLYEDARLEFEQLRESISLSPESLYRLANYLVEIGLYRSAIYASRQILDLAGMNDATTLNAPRYFNYLRFGTYYSDLVTPAAQTYGFHPLFIYSVIRQESLFEGFINSSAGARGLMQIIPSTGQHIYEMNGWPSDYTEDDLYRPHVSIAFGTDHLDELRTQFNGDLYATLAGYNAGPGNSSIWKELAGGDQDLFLEIIRFEETQNYIRGIYEIYSIYRFLYDRLPPI